MAKHLILKLQGPMQAWGTHTYEDFRPTHAFPTLSGVVGLLGACLGLDRGDRAAAEGLAQSLEVAVRVDRHPRYQPVTITDFHTVLDARKVGGGVNPYPVVSRREYLCDAAFTVALRERAAPRFALADIAEAVRRPVYTPVLGRRSCPLARPLFEVWVEAPDFAAALAQVNPGAGIIYGVEPEHGSSAVMMRDVPLATTHRQFGTRKVHVLVTEGSTHVPQ